MPLDQAKGAPRIGDTFVFSVGAKKGRDVMLTDVVVDVPPIPVLAKNPATGKVRQDDGDTDHATVLLYRVAPEKISADIKDETVGGVLAYSAVCTHQGCLLTKWDAAHKQFLCPCHAGTFDPLQGGANTGGPHTRTLPQVPLKAVGGKLVVASQIVGWVGVKRGSFL